MAAEQLPWVLSDAELRSRLDDPEIVGVFSDNGCVFVFWPLSRAHRYYVMNAYKWQGEAWGLAFDQVDSGLPSAAQPFHGGWISGYAWRLGRSFRLGTPRRGPITLEYCGERFEVTPDSEGYWAFIRETSPEDGDYWEGPRFIPSHQV